MKIEGKIYKSGKFWMVEVPALDLMTQGMSRKEGYEMVADMIETIVDQPGFKTTIEPVGSDRFYLGANNERALVTLAFRRARERRGYSIRQTSKERGSMKLDAFTKHLEDLGSHMDLVLVRRARKKRKAA